MMPHSQIHLAGCSNSPWPNAPHPGRTRAQLGCIISVHSVVAFYLHIKLLPASTSHLRSKCRPFAWSVIIITLQPQDSIAGDR